MEQAAVSIFYAHYGCHQGALAMRRSDGKVFYVRGNVGLWDMTAVLIPADECPPGALDDYDRDDFVCVKAPEFAKRYLVLDEGKDRLTEQLRNALKNLAK